MHYIPLNERYETYTVYAIEDVRNHEVRTVGFTSDIYQVCYDLYAVNDLSDEDEAWVIDLYNQGYAPILHILDAGIEDEERAAKIKRYWSRHYHYVNQRDLPTVPSEDDIRRQGVSRRRELRTEKLRGEYSGPMREREW